MEPEIIVLGTNVNDLPPEILLSIFQYSNTFIDNAFLQLPLVCRRWSSIVQGEIFWSHWRVGEITFDGDVWRDDRTAIVAAKRALGRM